MKPLLVILLTFFVLHTTAQEKKADGTSLKKEHKLEAQNANPEALANIETKKLTKQLELTTAQESSVYDAYLDHFNAEIEMKQKVKSMIASNDESKKKEIKKAISEQKAHQTEKLNNRLKSILTPTQFERFKVSSLDRKKSKEKVIIRKN